MENGIKKRKTLKTIKVTTDEDSPIDVEIVAEAIELIAKKFSEIEKGRLSRRAVIVLLHDLIGPQHINKKQIELVLEYGPLLRRYLK